MDNIILEFTEVSKFSLKNINLKVEKGEFLVISGKGGSGKTTLLKLASGELIPDAGTINIPNRKKIGFISQQRNILEEKSVFANLEIPLKLLGEYNKGAVLSTIEKLGLLEYQDTKALELSSSHQQLLKIALSVAKKPLLLLADEPFQNLDPEQEAQASSLLKDINTLGTTILFATSRTPPPPYFTRELRLANGEIIYS